MKNEPAFPNPINPQDYGKGMTLRDYFAAKAMQGLLSSGSANWNQGYSAFADDAYKMADAMLAERAK